MKNKIEFTDNSYIELNQDGTHTIVGNDAHTFYFEILKGIRKNEKLKKLDIDYAIRLCLEQM